MTFSTGACRVRPFYLRFLRHRDVDQNFCNGTLGKGHISCWDLEQTRHVHRHCGVGALFTQLVSVVALPFQVTPAAQCVLRLVTNTGAKIHFCKSNLNRFLILMCPLNMRLTTADKVPNRSTQIQKLTLSHSFSFVPSVVLHVCMIHGAHSCAYCRQKTGFESCLWKKGFRMHGKRRHWSVLFGWSFRCKCECFLFQWQTTNSVWFLPRSRKALWSVFLWKI